MSKPGKLRLDQLLVERGLVETRSRAQAMIMAGNVYSDTKRLDKSGQQVKADIPIEIKGQDHPWVSRGGLKLEKGLKEFDIDVTGKTCIDVGASTGGFTDVLLEGGAAKVYAVDVGSGQLAWKLRSDERVVVMEKPTPATSQLKTFLNPSTWWCAMPRSSAWKRCCPQPFLWPSREPM